MSQKRAAAMCVACAAIIVTTVAPRAAAPLTAGVFATGLKSPTKLIVTPGHNVLVSETGDVLANFVKHEGRVSIVDPSGNVRALLSKLPSALDLDNAGPAGVGGLLLHGDRTLYLQIGVGDVVKRNASNQEVPNPAGLSSALFSSIWRVSFSDNVDWLAEGFVLDPATDYATLADGGTVELANSAGEFAFVSVVADIRDLMPGANVVMASNPFGLLLRGGRLYYPDAGYNALGRVNAKTGEQTTIAHFPPVPNTAPFGPPVSQAVPNSIRGLVGNSNAALVTLFSGFPFGRGASSVRLVNLKTGEQTPFIPGLTMAIDTLPQGRGTSNLLVLEYASAFTPPGPGGPAQFVSPGRVLRFATPTSPAEVLVDTLTTPTSMDLDQASGTLYISERGSGRIMKVDLP